MADIHIIVGNVGAGKSTYAARLAEQERAHIFTNDDWMATLFMMDAPEPIEYAWALERTQRIERQILKESFKLAQLGLSTILDLGFFSDEQRQRVCQAIHDNGQKPILHYLDVDTETRWQRVRKRNEEKTETFQFEVSKEIFDFCETLFEPIQRDQIPAFVDFRTF